MEQVRCVIANMPQKLLADIVENMVEESGDMQVVDRVNSISEVKAVIDKNPVDLLILGLKSIDLPQSCVGIMNESPNLAIVGLVDDGRRLACFLDNVGKSDILRIIRTLCGTGSVPRQ
jgi:hypothetical protein